MEIKTADQLMRLITGVRLHCRGTLRADEFNYMVKAKKEGMTMKDNYIYRNKLSLIKGEGICPLNWAYQEAKHFRTHQTNISILKGANEFADRLQDHKCVSIDSVDVMIRIGNEGIAIWAAQDRANIQAFSDRFNSGTDLDFISSQIWDGVMRLYPIFRDIEEKKFKAV